MIFLGHPWSASVETWLKSPRHGAERMLRPWLRRKTTRRFLGNWNLYTNPASWTVGWIRKSFFFSFSCLSPFSCWDLGVSTAVFLTARWKSGHILHRLWSQWISIHNIKRPKRPTSRDMAPSQELGECGSKKNQNIRGGATGKQEFSMLEDVISYDYDG